MSYILDALKKADAQRERDPARGIHAHPAPVGPARTRDAGSPWMWAGAAVVVAIIGGGAWALLQDRPAAVPAPVVASNTAPAVIAPPVAVAPPAPAPVPATAPAAPATTATPNEPVAAVVLPPPEPPRAVARVEPEEEPPGSVRHRPRARVPVSPVAPGVASAASASSAAPNAPPGSAPGHALAPTPAAAEAIATGLPADAPKLAVTGGVYSANRAQRMLIVNGNVVSEGADLGGGVVLEEIKPKSAVLRFRGGRYSVAF